MIVEGLLAGPTKTRAYSPALSRSDPLSGRLRLARSGCWEDACVVLITSLFPRSRATNRVR